MEKVENGHQWCIMHYATLPPNANKTKNIRKIIQFQTCHKSIADYLIDGTCQMVEEQNYFMS